MPRYSVQQHHQLLHNLKETSLLTCTLDMLDMTGGAAVRLKFRKPGNVWTCTGIGLKITTGSIATARATNANVTWRDQLDIMFLYR